LYLARQEVPHRRHHVTERTDLALKKWTVETRVQAVAVVEGFDVIEDRQPSLLSGEEVEGVELLGLQRVEEALGRGVVGTTTGTAHAADDPVTIETVLVLRAEVLTAAIAVMDESGLGRRVIRA